MLDWNGDKVGYVAKRAVATLAIDYRFFVFAGLVEKQAACPYLEMRVRKRRGVAAVLRHTFA